MFPGEKVVVSEEALDDWIAQMYGFSIDNIPGLKPNGMPQEAYDMLKKYKKNRAVDPVKNKNDDSKLDLSGQEHRESSNESKKSRVERTNTRLSAICLQNPTDYHP